MSIIWRPKRAEVLKTNVYRFMQRLGFEEREDFLRFSAENPEAFWSELEKEMGVAWFVPYSRVLDLPQGPEWARWFTGGQINIAWNCLDRWVNTPQPACVWRNERGARREVSFRDLTLNSNRLAHYLRSLGIEAGDRVALCAPLEPEILTVLYACLKIGAILVPIFSGYSAAEIASLLDSSGARMVFTTETVTRRGKRTPMREKVNEALERPNKVEHVLNLSEIHSRIELQPSYFDMESLPPEAPWLLLFTPGTGGKPKGCLHSHAGALLQAAKDVYLAFDHKPTDRFFWLTDFGWMMGAWTIIGNHHFGGTVFLYDGAPDHPDGNRLWQILEDERITTFGLSPGDLRLLRNTSKPDEYPLESLRLLGSCGAPWDETSWLWYYERIGKGRCPVIDIVGATEIFGAFLEPLPIQSLKPCSVGGPAPGIAATVVDEKGRPVQRRGGFLVSTKPNLSMTAGIWGDPARYVADYWTQFPSCWSQGDWASIDEDGHWFLHGRASDCLNVGGRKVGPGEVEQILCEHPGVAEAAVIGVPGALKGDEIVAFVVARQNPRLPLQTTELAAHLIREMGAQFRPKAIHVVADLPKTFAGKIVHRLIRQKYLGEELTESSAVGNPSALDYVPRRR